MKPFRVAEARAKFGDLLDEAEKGDTVVIERHGVRFSLRVEQPALKRPRPGKLFENVDPDVMNGQWTWTWGSRGLQFRAPRKRR